MPINILTNSSDIFFSFNYNKILSDQLNVFLKTNIQETSVTPHRTQIIEKKMFQKGGIYHQQRFRVHSRYSSNR